MKREAGLAFSPSERAAETSLAGWVESDVAAISLDSSTVLMWHLCGQVVA
jgi:hypothetical protein